jgi:hypothetical protein
VHFRGYRPLGGKLLSVTFRLKAGRRPVFFSLTFLSPKPALVIPSGSIAPILTQLECACVFEFVALPILQLLAARAC